MAVDLPADADLELEERSVRTASPETVDSALFDLFLAAVGLVVGLVIMYLISRNFEKPMDYLVFACIGAGFPFGWRVLGFLHPFRTIHVAWGSDIGLVLIIWMIPLFALAIKVNLALLLGVPMLILSAIKHALLLLLKH